MAIQKVESNVKMPYNDFGKFEKQVSEHFSDSIKLIYVKC